MVSSVIPSEEAQRQHNLAAPAVLIQLPHLHLHAIELIGGRAWMEGASGKRFTAAGRTHRLA
jgi:hypothetical protein